MNDVTQLLENAERGDKNAARELLPIVYEELRRLAARQMGQEKPGQTLDPTALVHEAFVRLVKPADGAGQTYANRRHFFAAAAEAMRRILVENARRKRRLKRGGDLVREEFDERLLISPEPREDVVAVDEALQRLAANDPLSAELVQLRYFGGLAMPEIAKLLDLSERTAERRWAYAKAWLFRELAK